MKFYSFNNSFPAGNPIANIFVVIVGTLAIAASVVLGFFAFIIVGSIVLIMASIIGIRVWWLKRQIVSGGTDQHGNAPPAASGVIEGEFQVVDEDRKGE